MLSASRRFINETWVLKCTRESLKHRWKQKKWSLSHPDLDPVLDFNFNFKKRDQSGVCVLLSEDHSSPAHKISLTPFLSLFIDWFNPFKVTELRKLCSRWWNFLVRSTHSSSSVTLHNPSFSYKFLRSKVLQIPPIPHSLSQLLPKLFSSVLSSSFSSSSFAVEKCPVVCVSEWSEEI